MSAIEWKPRLAALHPETEVCSYLAKNSWEHVKSTFNMSDDCVEHNEQFLSQLWQASSNSADTWQKDQVTHMLPSRDSQS